MRDAAMKKKIHLLFVVGIWLIAANGYAAGFDGATVKLYSEGKLVATYEAKSGGRLVGSCYVFESKSEIHRKAITVCGTFTVEEKK